MQRFYLKLLLWCERISCSSWIPQFFYPSCSPCIVCLQIHAWKPSLGCSNREKYFILFEVDLDALMPIGRNFWFQGSETRSYKRAGSCTIFLTLTQPRRLPMAFKVSLPSGSFLGMHTIGEGWSKGRPPCWQGQAWSPSSINEIVGANEDILLRSRLPWR